MPRKSAEALGVEIFMQQRAMESATAEMIAHWRRAYDEAQHPRFRFDTGCRHWLTGDEARRRYYELHGIPSQLIAEWDAEQRR